MSNLTRGSIWTITAGLPSRWTLPETRRATESKSARSSHVICGSKQQESIEMKNVFTAKNPLGWIYKQVKGGAYWPLHRQRSVRRTGPHNFICIVSSRKTTYKQRETRASRRFWSSDAQLTVGDSTPVC